MVEAQLGVNREDWGGRRVLFGSRNEKLVESKRNRCCYQPGFAVAPRLSRIYCNMFKTDLTNKHTHTTTLGNKHTLHLRESRFTKQREFKTSSWRIIKKKFCGRTFCFSPHKTASEVRFCCFLLVGTSGFFFLHLGRKPKAKRVHPSSSSHKNEEEKMREAAPRTKFFMD